MLAGHIGIAIGAHGIRKTVPLWTLILAAQLPDWTDGSLCLAGAQSAIPGEYSHSFLAVVLLAALATVAWYAVSRDASDSLLVGAVVISHAVGDYFTGLKPSWPGGPMIGLELYERPSLDFILEASVIVAGWFIYQRSFPRERRYSRNVLLLLAALLLIQVAADIVLSLSPGLKKC